MPNSRTPEGTMLPYSTYRLLRLDLCPGLPLLANRSTPSTHGVFEALSPGPPSRLPTLQPCGHPQSRKARLPRGRAHPRVGLAGRSTSSSFSPTSSCRLLPALPPRRQGRKERKETEADVGRESGCSHEGREPSGQCSTNNASPPGTHNLQCAIGFGRTLSRVRKSLLTKRKTARKVLSGEPARPCCIVSNGSYRRC